MNDPDSQAEYGLKALKVSRDVNDPEEVGQAAAWLLHRYADARPRCDTLQVEAHTLNGADDGELLALAYGADVGERLHAFDLPATAPSDELNFFIEGLEVAFQIDGSVTRWSTMLSVSDAALSDAWILEDDYSGILDDPACVAIY